MKYVCITLLALALAAPAPACNPALGAGGFGAGTCGAAVVAGGMNFGGGFQSYQGQQSITTGLGSQFLFGAQQPNFGFFAAPQPAFFVPRRHNFFGVPRHHGFFAARHHGVFH